MEQLKNQVEEQPPAGAASAARPSPASQPLFGMGGIMRLPGRMAAGATGSSEALPGQEGLSDERIDAIRLGPLAGLSISNESTGVFDVCWVVSAGGRVAMVTFLACRTLWPKQSRNGRTSLR